MKRLVAGLVVLGLVTLVLVFPTPALAHHRGHFWGGFAAGAVTGAIVGHVFAPRVYYAAPPAVLYQPPPVYYPATTCYDYWVNGYWWHGTWVGSHWERACR